MESKVCDGTSHFNGCTGPAALSLNHILFKLTVDENKKISDFLKPEKHAEEVTVPVVFFYTTPTQSQRNTDSHLQ